MASSSQQDTQHHHPPDVGNYLNNFRNLLGPGMSDLTDMTKRYGPAFPNPKDSHVTPADLKRLVMASERIQTLIETVNFISSPLLKREINTFLCRNRMVIRVRKRNSSTTLRRS